MAMMPNHTFVNTTMQANNPAVGSSSTGQTLQTLAALDHAALTNTALKNAAPKNAAPKNTALKNAVL
jgi:hypothetical protein